MPPGLDPSPGYPAMNTRTILVKTESGKLGNEYPATALVPEIL